MSYIESELEALEREQEAIDQKASTLEKKLRAVMGGATNSMFHCVHFIVWFEPHVTNFYLSTPQMQKMRRKSNFSLNGSL